jgi:hypothetical protein
MLPARPLDGLLCAFGRGNTTFALGTPDGRVRTYDTGRLASMADTPAVLVPLSAYVSAGMNILQT